MLFEVHVAAEIVEDRGGIAVMLGCNQDGKAGSRQMTFSQSTDDKLFCELKATEIALSCIKNKWKSSTVVLYMPDTVHKLLIGRSNVDLKQRHLERVEFLKGLCGTFPSLVMRTPAVGSVQADALECAKTGITKDTGTMLTE